MCCSAVSQLLMIGKSVIANANKAQDNDSDDIMKIDWPEDSIEKAKVIRIRVQSMTGKVEEVSNSFITGTHILGCPLPREILLGYIFFSLLYSVFVRNCLFLSWTLGISYIWCFTCMH